MMPLRSWNKDKSTLGVAERHKRMATVDGLRREIIEIYKRRARRYDLAANLYYLIGYPEWRYRRLTVESLDLRLGDTVVEIGCGTGLNFGLIQERIGPNGDLIRVDLTAAMLAQAKERVQRQGWQNVDLVHQDAAEYESPGGIDAICSTFALSMLPEAPRIIERGATALRPGGRISVMDLKIPSGWPEWLVDAVMRIVKPFTPTDEWRSRLPWAGIEDAMATALGNVTLRDFYLGTTYLISGEKTA